MEGQESTHGSAATSEDVSLRDAIWKELGDQGIHGIRVDVCGGDVVLSGEIDSEWHHERALDVAQTVPGVHGVLDALEVAVERGTEAGVEALRAEEDRHIRHKSPHERPTRDH